MLRTFTRGVVLFLRGRPFQDARQFMRQALLGIAITAALCICLALAGLAFWLAAGIAALVGGAIQPWLFRNLRYQ